jgi:DNA-binding LacI/PurR family transcriptional regulator
VTAVISRQDEQAVHLHNTLVSAGFRVPEDISLVGSDDTHVIIGDAKENILTTVRLPLVEIGREGANLLIHRVLGEEPEDRDVILPVELIVRGSTAPPRKRAG